MLKALWVPKLSLALVLIGSKRAKVTVGVFAAMAIGSRGIATLLCSSLVTTKGDVGHTDTKDIWYIPMLALSLVQHCECKCHRCHWCQR